MPRLRASLAAHLPAFGFAAYPTVFLVGANAGIVPIDAGAVAQSLRLRSVPPPFSCWPPV